MDLNIRQSVVPKVLQRTLLLGRVKMAQAIHLRESEWAKALSEVEADPLFQELIHAQIGSERIVQYKKLGRNKLSGQFYEEQDLNVIGGGGDSPETLLNRKKHLLQMIQQIGQENFEKYFLYREESVDPQQISVRCSMPVEKVKELQDFVMEMSVHAEFYHPSALQAHNLVKPTLIGKVIRNDDGTYSMSYYFPHLARGLYDINTTALKKWQKTKGLDREQASKLRKYVGLLELSNLRQGAFWRVVEYLLRIQKEYFDTQDSTKLAPVSLRYVARTLQFAPSTISRVLGTKSILLPWDREVMMSALMPGQRRVVMSILERMLLSDGGRSTDASLAHKIETTFGIKISRRTITACRHALSNIEKKAA